MIDAAKAAGVAKLVYTSAPKATTGDYALAADHKATEEAIAASGVPAVIVRHNWYTENYVADVTRAASTGTIAASVGDGRVASATRADYADGDAVVLLEDGHLGQVYEFGGDVAWDYSELAAAASEVVGRPVEFVSLTTAEHVAALESVGLDAGTAAFVAGIDDAIRRGVLGGLGRDAVAPHRAADDAARGGAAGGGAGAGAVGGLSRVVDCGRVSVAMWLSGDVAK